MIFNVEGHVFNATQRVIAHGCDCQGNAFLSSRAFKQRWPQVYEAYRETCNTSWFTPGSCLLAPSGDGKIIATLGIQRDTRSTFDPDILFHIRSSLARLRTHLELLRINEVAMSRLGDGLSGLTWAGDILPVVDEVFADNICKIKVYVYSNKYFRR